MAESGWWTSGDLIRAAVFGTAVGAEVGAVVLDHPSAVSALKIACPLSAVVLASFGLGFGPVFNARHGVRGGTILFPAVSLVWGAALGALLVALVCSWPGTAIGLAIGYFAAGQFERPRSWRVLFGAAVFGSLIYAMWSGTDVSAGIIGRAAAIGFVGGPMSIMLYALIGTLFVHRVGDE